MSYATLRLNLSGRTLDLEIRDMVRLIHALNDRGHSCADYAALEPEGTYWHQEQAYAKRLEDLLEDLVYDRIEKVGADLDEGAARL